MCHGLLVFGQSILPWENGLGSEAMNKEAAINERTKSTIMGENPVLILAIFGRSVVQDET